MRDSTTDPAYRGPEIRRELGEQLQLVLGLADRPETFGDWVRGLAAAAERDGIELTLETLCTTDESPHAARFDGETHHYRCALDPFIVPFLADDVEAVEIETRSPVSDQRIDVTVTEAAVEADPSDAVFSFGVDATVDDPPEDGLAPADAYSLFCPYGNAFASRDEYEEWADGVSAITTATDLAAVHEWAEAIDGVAR